ncbi:hypothetical protein LTR36_010966 [Oleoguttula mirabilis]|uniref:Uncharacterized protein n=1 Tax=Oleoguttula mirabilis TaxID=1507867 RepID=A0AAV9J472_9PEZI|nr:hypothetical protein LTR36_010966 [Oleoguttula mirabilis]
MGDVELKVGLADVSTDVLEYELGAVLGLDTAIHEVELEVELVTCGTNVLERELRPELDVDVVIQDVELATKLTDIDTDVLKRDARLELVERIAEFPVEELYIGAEDVNTELLELEAVDKYSDKSLAKLE